MRIEFFKYLYELMRENPAIWAITGDLGYIGFDRIRDEIPERFINTGAAEVAMMDIACGLAIEGKIPVVYSITPFLLYRPFEVIRTYINHERIPVIMIGSGRDSDYEHDGFSHYAGDDWMLFDGVHQEGILNNIHAYWPVDIEGMKNELKNAIDLRLPTYINLKR